MESRTVIIANPAARSGRLGRELEAIRLLVEDVLGPASLLITSKPREAESMLEALPVGTERVIGIGGDGTLNELVCGLARRKDDLSLGIIPFGSGNDLARALKISGNVRESVALLGRCQPVSIDTGEVTWTDGAGSSSRRFVNALGVGLDAWSAHYAPRYKGWPLGVGYSVAVLKALQEWIPAGTSIREQATGRVLHNGPLMFMTVGNAQDSGGGYRLNPHARLRDGLLDACMVEGITRWRALRMLPTARTGAHLKAREVRYEQVTALELDTDRGLPIHTDGEVCTLEGRRIGITVHPRSLTVLIDPAHENDI